MRGLGAVEQVDRAVTQRETRVDQGERDEPLFAGDVQVVQVMRCLVIHALMLTLAILRENA